MAEKTSAEEMVEVGRRTGGVRRSAGRPFVLKPDEKTLDQIRGLGVLWASYREVAVNLGVAYQTWMAFKKRCPEAEAAYQEGKDGGNLSLRRAQMQSALKGNVTMQIWLGKQRLDQRDERTFRGAGPGGAFPVVDYSKLTDEELTALATLGRKLGVEGFDQLEATDAVPSVP